MQRTSGRSSRWMKDCETIVLFFSSIVLRESIKRCQIFIIAGYILVLHVYRRGDKRKSYAPSKATDGWPGCYSPNIVLGRVY